MTSTLQKFSKVLQSCFVQVEGLQCALSSLKLEEDISKADMLRLFKVIFAVCFLLVPALFAFSVEEEALEEADYFPAHYACPDTSK